MLDDRLVRLLDVAAVVARLVGHQHDQQPAVLLDQARVVVDHLVDRVHRVLGARVVDLEVVDGLADQVDVGRRLLELVVEVVAEADDRVGQGLGGLLLGDGVDVDLQLGGDPVELLADRLLVVLHALRLVEEPDDRELVLAEVAEDLAGELVEGDADVAWPRR